jgi:hypothetical protein
MTEPSGGSGGGEGAGRGVGGGGAGGGGAAGGGGQPDPQDAARRQRCRGFDLATVLGLFLAGVSIYDRVWPAVVVGLVGAGLAFWMRRRICRDEAL